MTASALCQSLLIAVTNFSSKHDFPDAAEEVLEIYEKDTKQPINTARNKCLSLFVSAY